MFGWLNSPQLPDTVDTQVFRSISGGPTLRINALNDRTNRVKVIPWEDILEVFPNAIYLRDANGIVMPARDSSMKRQLQADVVLEVVSSQDPPPKTTRPENIEKTKDLTPNTTSTIPHSTTGHQTKSERSSLSTTASSTLTGLAQEDESDWSPFQANSTSNPAQSSSPDQKSLELLRQEMIHRMELLSAEQEERLNTILNACRRPNR
ncbi:hypothetical protein BGZ46_001771 [Entomortierella lignicola]|nr:hypothetical protein BGZ46_001771 [Entomortierella lignicola]